MLGLLTAAKRGTDYLSKNRFQSTEKRRRKYQLKKNLLQKKSAEKKEISCKPSNA